MRSLSCTSRPLAAFAQTTPVVSDIEVENVVRYVADVVDPARLATNAAVLVVLCAIDAHAQAYILLKGKEPIPREYSTYSMSGASSKPYKSWSIFLVTNQDCHPGERATTGRLVSPVAGVRPCHR
jgi:hypothetical protein